jgi:hypothetical protein
VHRKIPQGWSFPKNHWLTSESSRFWFIHEKYHNSW